MSLDASAQKMLDIIAAAQAKGAPPLHEVSPTQAREMHLRSKALFATEGPEIEDTTSFAIPGPAGAIPVRLYRPRGGSGPVVVYLHGGGWVIGDLDSHDGLCRWLCRGTGCAVLSVDYRLAPEHPFPAAVEDAFAALSWAAGAGGEHGLDPERIAVAGDSAGGNLAAVVCQLARAAGGPSVRAQILLYPATDLRCTTQSHLDFTNFMLTKEAYAWFLGHYLTHEEQRDDWRASPLRADRFDALPPAFVLTAGYDPLRDEGAAYAKRLRDAGVAVTYRCFDGQIHGFLTLDRVTTEATQAMDEVVAALTAALKP